LIARPSSIAGTIGLSYLKPTQSMNLFTQEFICLLGCFVVVDDTERILKQSMQLQLTLTGWMISRSRLSVLSQDLQSFSKAILAICGYAVMQLFHRIPSDRSFHYMIAFKMGRQRIRTSRHHRS
jgi:hypothetical protein